MSWLSSDGFDGVRDLLELATWPESTSNVTSKLAPGELVLVSYYPRMVLHVLHIVLVVFKLKLRQYCIIMQC